MRAKEILAHVDHTLLKQTATREDILRICEEAAMYQCCLVMIPSSFVKDVKEVYGNELRIGTVIGFPNGNCSSAAKLAEAAQALADGADELDMVINIGRLKGGDLKYVENEIRSLKNICGDRKLKVIVETCFLTEDEKKAACRCVTEAGADMIKTSTGFGTGGATLEDVELFRQNIGSGIGIKAAGGIHTREEMEAYLEQGCERIGASAAVSVLKEEFERDLG